MLETFWAKDTCKTISSKLDLQSGIGHQALNLHTVLHTYTRTVQRELEVRMTITQIVVLLFQQSQPPVPLASVTCFVLMPKTEEEASGD